MKSYTRIEDNGSYVNITDINDYGEYYQRNVWPDGTITSSTRTTLQEFGWKSFEDFMKNSLQARRFKLTGC